VGGDIGFKHASIKDELKEFDGCLRKRLRYYIWHNWMTERSRRVDAHRRHRIKGTAKRVGGGRKRKNLIRLGIDPDHAYAWSRTRKGGWSIAHKPYCGLYHYCSKIEIKGEHRNA